MEQIQTPPDKESKKTDTEVNNDFEINKDGRKKYEWQSKYEDTAQKKIKNESFILTGIFLLIIVLFFLNFNSILSHCLCSDQSQKESFEIFIYYIISGMLGGIVFGIKYFYRVVARGYWSEDRIYWRIFSPVRYLR